MTVPTPHLAACGPAREPAVALSVGRLAAAWCDIADLPDGRVTGRAGGWCQGLGSVDGESREYPDRAAALTAFRAELTGFLSREAALEPAQEEARQALVALLAGLDAPTPPTYHPDATYRALEDIRTRLAAGARPEDLIPTLVPTSALAVQWWARRLALWAEFADRLGPQAVAIARLAALRGMRRFGLALGEDGGVAAGRPVWSDTPTTAFRLGDVRVEYIRERCRGQDHYQFTADGDAPIPFTGGRYYSHFAPSDAVAAVGGPEAYLARYVDAKASGREKEFLAAFTEPYREAPRRAKRLKAGPAPPPVAEPDASPPPPVRLPPPPPPPAARPLPATDPPVKTQGTLF